MRHRNLSILMILGLLLVMPRFAYAYSFAGDDWLLDMTGTLHINVAGIIQTDEPVNQVDEPITITQSSLTDITVPIYLPDPINETFYLPGTVSGTYVHSYAYIAEYGPITFEYENNEYTVKLMDVHAQLDGDATGINPSVIEDYGARVYYITGRPSPDSYVDADIYMNLFSTWTKVGEADMEISSWNAERAEVPEPGTIVMLLGLAASLAGYGWLRRR